MVILFGIFVLICGIGLGIIGWVLLKKDTSKEEKLSPDLLLDRPAAVPKDAPKMVSSTLSKEEEKHIEEEIDLTLQMHELKEKYEKLDSLFKEKSSELEKIQRSLETELRTRKEFNKVKDILEKELKDVKDRSHNVQIELISAKTETEGCQKRINQLEAKVTKLEKEILRKEQEIENLIKKQGKLEPPKNIPPVTPPTEIPTKEEAPTDVKTEIKNEEEIDKETKGEENV